jgi:hypothetical protein
MAGGVIMMWLNMHIRTGDRYLPSYQYNDRTDSCGVSVPLELVWWEGPNDLHLQMRSQGGDGENRVPLFLEEIGDYMIPNPYAWGDEFVLCYSMMVQPTRNKGLILADEYYVLRLERLWASPNLPEWEGREDYKAYLRKYKAWEKRKQQKPKKGK